MTFALSSAKLLHKDDWIHIWLKLCISLATLSSEKTFVLTKWLVLKGSKPRTKWKLKQSKKDKTIGTFSLFQFRAMISFNPNRNLNWTEVSRPENVYPIIYLLCFINQELSPLYFLHVTSWTTKCHDFIYKT